MEHTNRMNKKIKSVQLMFDECWKNEDIDEVRVSSKGSFDGLDTFKILGLKNGKKVKKSYIKIELFNQY